MEVMMGQQPILMSLANVVPPVPEQPTGPIASQPVAPPQPAPVIALPVQPQREWDIDAVSRDASDILEGESIEAEVASQHSEQDIELQCPSAALRSELGMVSQLLVKLPSSTRGLRAGASRLWWWPEGSSGSRKRVQEPDKAPLLDAPITPGHTFGPVVEEMLQRSIKAREASQQMAKMWPNKPFQPKRPQEHQWRRTPPQQQAQPRGSKTSPSVPSARCQPTQGANEAGLASFPPVDAAFTTLVKTPTLSGLTKDPACPNKQCRTTEVHLKKGYAAATEAVKLSNVASLLTVYQAALISDLPECPSAALRSELGMVSQLLVKLPSSTRGLRAGASRLWWWPEGSSGSCKRVQEPDKAPLLDAPITPGHTFGPVVEEMLQRSIKAREASQQMAKMWPNKPFQPKRPQEHQWRRTPPQQQAQPRGSKTSPSVPSARCQPTFVRPQRGGWRPRGGGRPRPCGSGQAPRDRAQPKQP
ncbi:UNVERIFIED_CONTAM: hypothetical protein FKN15_050982 [Acipenser sinensis]